jgi:hypothetical protein
MVKTKRKGAYKLAYWCPNGDGKSVYLDKKLKGEDSLWICRVCCKQFNKSQLGEINNLRVKK